MNYLQCRNMGHWPKIKRKKDGSKKIFFYYIECTYANKSMIFRLFIKRTVWRWFSGAFATKLKPQESHQLKTFIAFLASHSQYKPQVFSIYRFYNKPISTQTTCFYNKSSSTPSVSRKFLKCHTLVYVYLLSTVSESTKLYGNSGKSGNCTSIKNYHDKSVFVRKK